MTQPASLISRLPAHMRTPFLRRLSANANQPGGSKGPKQYGGGALGRGAGAFIQAAMNRGIVIIESRPSSLNADIAINPSKPPTSLDMNYGSGATPATSTLTSSLGQPVAYSGAGTKDVTVTSATVNGVTQDYQGAAQIVV